MVQEMLGLCDTENGPKLMICCKPEQVGTREHGNVLKRIQVSKTAESLQRRQKMGY